MAYSNTPHKGIGYSWIFDHGRSPVLLGKPITVTIWFYLGPVLHRLDCGSFLIPSNDPATGVSQRPSTSISVGVIGPSSHMVPHRLIWQVDYRHIYFFTGAVPARYL